MGRVPQGLQEVRFNELDWTLLEVLSDGRRYTPKHLYADVEALDDWSADYIRQEVGRLYNDGLIERVGTSSMYVITELGEAALDVRDEISDDMEPREISDLVRSAAAT